MKLTLMLLYSRTKARYPKRAEEEEEHARPGWLLDSSCCETVPTTAQLYCPAVKHNVIVFLIKVTDKSIDSEDKAFNHNWFLTHAFYYYN